MRAKFCTFVIQLLRDLHSGSGVRRQGEGVESTGETEQICCF